MHLSGSSVGVGDIHDRDVVRDGKTERQTSVELGIHDDSAAKVERRETVSVGSILTLGPDRYCVVEIRRGTENDGVVSLRKLAR
jgi:hypothetical protein